MSSHKAVHRAWVIRHALESQIPILTNDQLQLVDPELQPLYYCLRAIGSQPMEVRQRCVQDYMKRMYYDFNEAASRRFWAAVKEADPYSPIPQYDAVFLPDRLPTLDDLDEIPDDEKFLWSGRLVRGCLNLVAANPKTAKSTLLLWLGRLLWFGLPMPGSTQAIYPAQTRSLWLLGDDNASEIADRARSFGLPGSAIQLCASPESPYDCFSLDEAITPKIIEHFLANEAYGMVVVDSAIRTTRKRMFDSADVDEVWKPLIRIVRAANVALIATLHTSKDGESLGRRLEGAARSVSKLYRVGKDTTESVRRKLTTVTNRVRTAQDLMLTIHDDRIEFGDCSIQEPDAGPKKRGRRSTARDEAKEFILESLSTGPDTWNEIRSRWGGDRMTLSRARNDLEQSHEIRVTVQEDEQRLELLG
jgi:hypothetical protein